MRANNTNGLFWHRFLILLVPGLSLSINLLGQRNSNLGDELFFLKEKSYQIGDKETLKAKKLIFDEEDQLLIINGDYNFGAEVRFIGTDEIILGPGFEAKEGSEFLAELEKKDNPQLLIFPNPTLDGRFFVKLQGSKYYGMNYQLVNILGELVEEGKFQKGRTFDLSNQVAGTFVLKIISSGKKQSLISQKSIIFHK